MASILMLSIVTIEEWYLMYDVQPSMIASIDGKQQIAAGKLHTTNFLKGFSLHRHPSELSDSQPKTAHHI